MHPRVALKVGSCYKIRIRVGIENMKRFAISAPVLVPAALLAPVLLAGCAMTSTYGTGHSPEVAMFSEMTGGLLDKNEKKEPIEYQPRAPLVMPPAGDPTTVASLSAPLPPPMETASAVSADWPMDPSERIGASSGSATAYNMQSEYERLRPLADAFPEQERRAPPRGEDFGKQDYYDTIVNSRSQREEFSKALAESKGFSRTERRFLTDPPLTYREPVATAPTGEVALEEGVKKKKKGNFLTRWWTGG
jgi:hypothetical protein